MIGVQDLGVVGRGKKRVTAAPIATGRPAIADDPTATSDQWTVILQYLWNNVGLLGGSVGLAGPSLCTYHHSKEQDMGQVMTAIAAHVEHVISMDLQLMPASLCRW